jgi:hypothetical protein
MAGCLNAALIALCATAAVPRSASAEFPHDLGVSYEALYVGDASLGGETVQANFLVQELGLELGYEDFGFGLLVRDTRRLDLTSAGQSPEVGVMLTGRYTPVLTNWLRLDAGVRLGLTHHLSGSSCPVNSRARSTGPGVRS